MEIPVKLLPDGVDEHRVFRLGEVVDVFAPERNREADEQHNVDENNGKLEVSRNRARDALVVRAWIATLVKTNQDVGEKREPADEERGHEPMRELDDVIDLVAMLGSVRRLTENLINQGETINHTAQDLLP